MSLRIYDIARNALSTGGFDWTNDQMVAAIPKLGYEPVLDVHTYIAIAQPFRTTAIELTNQAVHQAGWWQFDPVSLQCPMDGPVDTVLFYRQSDTMLVLAVQFPAVIAVKPTPLVLMYGISDIGACRP